MQRVVVEWVVWDRGGGMGDGFGLGYGWLRRLWFVGATTRLTFAL